MPNMFHDATHLLAYYGVQAAEFRMRHDAIFTSIRHFSWLLSVLLGSPVALLVGKDWRTVRDWLPYLVALPTLGILFAMIGFFVVRREYHFYNESEARLLYLERELDLTSRSEFLDGRLFKATQDGFSVSGFCVAESRIGTPMPWKARIRALFLSSFLIFALVGCGEIAVTVILLCRQ